MSERRVAVVPVTAALGLAAALAVYPSSEHGAAVFWLLVDLALLLRAARGHRWALTTLAFTSTLGAVLFLVAGSVQLVSDPRYFLRGVAFGVAALLLIRARRVSRTVG